MRGRSWGQRAQAVGVGGQSTIETEGNVVDKPAIALQSVTTLGARLPFVQDINTKLVRQSGLAGVAGTIPCQGCGLCAQPHSAHLPLSHFMTNQFKSVDSTRLGGRSPRRVALRPLAGRIAHPARPLVRRELFRADALPALCLDPAPPQAQGFSRSIFLLCGLRGLPEEISGQFSSSSLSHSFARRRRTAAFLPAGAARRRARAPSSRSERSA